MSTAGIFLGINSLTFVLPVMFGSIPGLWAVLTLVPGHWLSTPSSSGPPLPQHLLQEGQIVGKRLFGYVNGPVPLLGALPGYRRWPVYAPYPQLPGDLAWVTLVGSREFLLC